MVKDIVVGPKLELVLSLKKALETKPGIEQFLHGKKLNLLDVPQDELILPTEIRMALARALREQEIEIL
ncbi:MAG: hypothetical protein AB1497_04870 [Bacillota bacterium]